MRTEPADVIAAAPRPTMAEKSAAPTATVRPSASQSLVPVSTPIAPQPAHTSSNPDVPRVAAPALVPQQRTATEPALAPTSTAIAIPTPGRAEPIAPAAGEPASVPLAMASASSPASPLPDKPEHG